jgi:hypothetical protein
VNFKVFLFQIQHFFPPLFYSRSRRKLVPNLANNSVFFRLEAKDLVRQFAKPNIVFDHALADFSQFSAKRKTGYAALYSAKQHTRFLHNNAQAKNACTYEITDQFTLEW